MSPMDVRLLVTFFFSYPLVGLLRMIPSARSTVKHVLVVGIAVFYLLFIFHNLHALSHIAFSCLTTYMIAKYIRVSAMPWIGAAFLTGHLSITQYAQMSSGDQSGLYFVHLVVPQMVLVTKLTAFCWNVHDGRRPARTLSAFQKDRAIKTLPTPLEYASYALYFPTLLYGPGFDYAEYRRFIDLSMFDSYQQQCRPSPTGEKYLGRRLPNGIWAACQKAVAGLLWTGLYFKLSAAFPLENLLSERFLQYGFAHRLLVLHLFALTPRANLYGVWALTEGACILSGVGYNGVDPLTREIRWDRLRNVNPWGVELAQNPHGYLGNWNISTCNWLRNYVYLRVTPEGQKPGFRASMATFLYSALWHGFHPGYYFTFIFAGVLQHVAKGLLGHPRGR